MQTHMLEPHPANPPRDVTGVSASLGWRPHWLTVRFRIEQAAGVVVPPLAGRGRTDGLWRTTCFELFLKNDEGPGYCEFNLSPSEQWAAYEFSGVRQGMADRTVPLAPTCTWRAGNKFAIFDAAIPLASLPGLPARAGLTAVIEEEGERMSYWALAHGGDKPDFHDPACFAAMLAPPEAP